MAQYIPKRDLTIKDIQRMIDATLIGFEMEYEKADYADERRTIAAKIRAVEVIRNWIADKLGDGISI